jgi:hypothetical protein
VCLSKAWVCVRSLAEIAGSNPAGGMDVCCDCFVLSGRGFCVGLITRPEESYRVLCVSQDDREASIMRRLWPTRVCCATEKISLCEFHFVQYRSGILHLTNEYGLLGEHPVSERTERPRN